MLIKADRTGSWLMHLQAVCYCLNCLCCSWALQLPAIRSLLHAANEQPGGKALISDLVIEQTLMKSLKSTDGLARGDGMTEELRNLWTLSAPVTSEHNSAMQDFTKLTYTTRAQHKDSTESRIKRHASDLEKIRTKIEACSPSTSDPTLRKIVNFIVAGPDVNVLRGWEQNHWRYNWKVCVYLQIEAYRKSPNTWEFLSCEDCSWSYHWSCPSLQEICPFVYQGRKATDIVQ